MISQSHRHYCCCRSSVFSFFHCFRRSVSERACELASADRFAGALVWVTLWLCGTSTSTTSKQFTIRYYFVNTLLCSRCSYIVNCTVISPLFLLHTQNSSYDFHPYACTEALIHTRFIQPQPSLRHMNMNSQRLWLWLVNAVQCLYVHTRITWILR